MGLEDVAIQIGVYLPEEIVKMILYGPLLPLGLPELGNLKEGPWLYDFSIFCNADKDDAVKEFLHHLVQGPHTYFGVMPVDILCQSLPPEGHVLQELPVYGDSLSLALCVFKEESFQRALTYCLFGEQEEFIQVIEILSVLEVNDKALEGVFPVRGEGGIKHLQSLKVGEDCNEDLFGIPGV